MGRFSLEDIYVVDAHAYAHVYVYLICLSADSLALCHFFPFHIFVRSVSLCKVFRASACGAFHVVHTSYAYLIPFHQVFSLYPVF